MSVSSRSRALRRHRLVAGLAAALALSAESLVCAGPVWPAPAGGARTRYVANCDDTGSGSLRNTVAAAATGDTIDLSALTCSTITLASGAIVVTQDDLRLRGMDADRLAIDGGHTSNIIRHTGTGAIEIDRLTLRNGYASGASGGCIYSRGSVVLYDTTVTACTSRTFGAYRVYGGGLSAAKQVVLYRSRVTGNHAQGDSASAYGGGIFAAQGVRATSSTISDNLADGLQGNGGGIAAVDEAEIFFSTISGNRAAFDAGVAVFENGPVPQFHVVATTITGNVATNGVGGIGVAADTEFVADTIDDNHDAGGFAAGLFVGENVTATLESTIVANNFSGTTRNDFGGQAGITLTGSNNLIMSSGVPLPPGTLTTDPELLPLADNGGPVQTQALPVTSVAVDAGNTSYSLPYDQRTDGFARVVGGAADIGAYEVQSTGATRLVTSCADSGAGSLREAVTLASSGDTIDLRSAACSTITLTTGELVPGPGNLTLLGPGAASLTIDGSNVDRVFYHLGDGTLTLRDVTIAHGRLLTSSSFAAGGCVYSEAKVVLQSVVVTGCSVAGGGRQYGGGLAALNVDVEDSTIAANRIDVGPNEGYGAGVWSFGNAVIRRSTIRDNEADETTGHSGAGGVGVRDELTIDRSTISGNSALYAGGIASGSDAFSQAPARIVDSTISGNHAGGFGSGVLANGPLELFNSTVTANVIEGLSRGSAPTGSPYNGAVLIGGAADVQSSILFGNTSTGGARAYDIADFNNAILIGANDLIGAPGLGAPPGTINADPGLGPLQDNGGPTFTHAIGRGSPAVDAGNDAAGLATDQRGVARVFGGAADIGAFELDDRIFADGFDDGASG